MGSDEWVSVAVHIHSVTRLSYYVSDTGAPEDAVWICRHHTDNAYTHADVGRNVYLKIRHEIAESLGFVDSVE